jgi:hypothetical protein
VTHFGRTSAVGTGSGDPWPDSGGGQGTGWLPILPSTSLYALRPAAAAGGSSCSRTFWNALRPVVGSGLGRWSRAGQRPRSLVPMELQANARRARGSTTGSEGCGTHHPDRGARHGAEHLAVGHPSKGLDTSHQGELVFQVFAGGGHRNGSAAEHSDAAQRLGFTLHWTAASKAEFAPAAIGWRASGPFRNRDVCPWPGSRRCRCR